MGVRNPGNLNAIGDAFRQIGNEHIGVHRGALPNQERRNDFGDGMNRNERPNIAQPVCTIFSGAMLGLLPTYLFRRSLGGLKAGIFGRGPFQP